MEKATWITMIAPLTTRSRRAVLPSHTLMLAGMGGVTYNSAFHCEQIRVIVLCGGHEPVPVASEKNMDERRRCCYRRPTDDT